MNQHPDCTPNDLLHMIDAPTPRRPEDMTIEEMAAEENAYAPNIRAPTSANQMEP